MTDEQILIKRAQNGETDAFRILVERSKVNVYRLAYDLTGNLHDAEDLSQEVFVKAFKSLGSFRGESRWGTWLYRITVNACLDHRKSRQVMMNEFTEEHDRQPDGAHTSPEEAADARMIRESIERALDRLSPAERTVFVLRHYHDMSLKAIAGMLAMAEGTVKSHLFRGVRRLQECLSDFREDHGREQS